jgi:nitric oxide dioxygenase
MITSKNGDLLQIHAPLGDFMLNKSDRPVVLLRGGAGITAMLSMLEPLAEQDGDNRQVVFLHATATERIMHSVSMFAH